MTLVKGTNCGFVTEAPVDDPAGSTSDMGGYARAQQDTSPATAARIIEIGWWCDNATEESNFEVGIYDHDSKVNAPKNLLEGKDRTNAKGTDAGWKRCIGLNITISPSTIYWIAVQLDRPATTTNTNYSTASDRNARLDTTIETLPDLWGTYSGTTSLYALYAVWEAEEAPSPTYTSINIGDAWKSVSGALLAVNIGDAWKTVASAAINIGDAWKNIPIS